MEASKTQPLWKIFKTATEKIQKLASLYDESMKWLEEMQDEIKKSIGSENKNISLLPKTPYLKRKRTESTVNHPDDETLLNRNDQHSTFVEGVKSKKLKIDDISTITEEQSNSSILNESKRSLRIRNRQKRSSVQPVRRSKRAKKKPSIVLINNTPSPEAAFAVPQSISPTVVVSPICHDISHSVQPRVAALIEKLKGSAKKTYKTPSLNEDADIVKSRLVFDDDCEETIEITISEDQNTPKDGAIHCDKENNEMKENYIIDDTMTSSPFQHNKIQKVSTPVAQSPLHIVSSVIVPIENENVEHYSLAANSSEEEKMDISNEESPKDVKPSEEDHHKTFTLEDNKYENDDEPLANKEIENIVAVNKSTTGNENKLSRYSDSGLSSDENILVEVDVHKKTTAVGAMSNMKHQAKLKNEMKEVNSKENIINIAPAPVAPKVAKMPPPKNVVSGVQTLVKPSDLNKKTTAGDVNWHGNIVTGIKSFLSKNDSPKRETEEEKQKKKIAELKKREELRLKAIKQQVLNKQKMAEQRKKLREEREKRFAEQKAKQLEEEERKKEQLAMKEIQVAKNQEEIRRLREQQDQKKRELRALKQVEAEKKRLREEEEQKRKALDQIQEENRRAEMLQRKAEYEEQERQKKRLEHERNERERLRQVEEERIMHEERKKREFEEKEQHRMLVDKKQKEEKEKERLEKLQLEERLRNAEKAIEEGRKREIEREKEKAKERLREEIKTNIKQGKTLKGDSKFIVNASKATRNSPRTLEKENFKAPSSNLANSIKSPAAYHPPANKMKKIYKPPKVPLKIRESTYTSYGIDDLSSEDSTDDETQPAKRIPSWAKGRDLQTQLLTQFYTDIDPDDIFIDCNEPCRLELIFQKRKERYFKRTSSAHWSSPILKAK